MKYALCVKLYQHDFTIVIVVKLLVIGHCSDSGLHSLSSRSSRCPRLIPHSGLRLNLNLCLFLQTFNAISESEYVKIGSMCIFFLISMICLSENALLYIFRLKSKSCSISIRQRLLFTNCATIFCSQFI